MKWITWGLALAIAAWFGAAQYALVTFVNDPADAWFYSLAMWFMVIGLTGIAVWAWHDIQKDNDD